MAHTKWLYSKRDPNDFISVSFSTVINPGDANCKLFIPANANYNKLVLYTHGVGETVDSVNIDSLKSDMVQRIYAQGWCILSHAASGDSWGNLASLNNYNSALVWAKSYAAFGEIVIFSQSMGGLSGLEVLAAHPEIIKWYGVYPATNLANMFTTSFKAAIKTAFGFTLDSDYATATNGYDPNLLATSLFSGKKLRMTASYSDVTVARVSNTDLFYTKVNGTAASIVKIDAIGVHGDTSHFLKNDIINFYNS
jgi:hypothetical protein